MRINRKTLTGVLLAVVMTMLFANSAWALPGDLRVKFLDIGQGDSILIQTPHGRTVLIDGGPGSTVLERLGEETSFWFKRFDLLVLTHPDLDHLEGLVEVLKRYQVDRMLLTGVHHRSRLYAAFLELLQEKQVELVMADHEQDWLLDEGVVLDVISPTESLALQDVDKPNDTSISTVLRYGETSMLLTGDAEEQQEQDILLSGADIRAQVFKGGHHGSVTSNDPRFLQASRAKEVVVVAGRDNPYDHPHLEVVLRYDERGLEWFSTKDEGTITYVSDGRSWRKD